MTDVRQPPGARLNLDQVEARLLGQTFDLPAPDAAFTQRIDAVLTGNMDDYGLARLDLADPAQPRCAEQRDSWRSNEYGQLGANSTPA